MVAVEAKTYYPPPHIDPKHDKLSKRASKIETPFLEYFIMANIISPTFFSFTIIKMQTMQTWYIMASVW